MTISTFPIGERRGVGGIFFDDLNQKSKETHFAFVKDCANSFLAAYGPIIQRRMALPFTEAQKHWQQLRRGRYVEFNLVYDRGTTFGLKTNARTESVLMSLPHHPLGIQPHPRARQRRSPYARSASNPRDWVSPQGAPVNTVRFSSSPYCLRPATSVPDRLASDRTPCRPL